MTTSIIKRRSIWLWISGIMFITGIACLAVWQLKLGIDFTGGTLLQIAYSQERPPQERIAEHFEAVGIKEKEIKAFGEKNALIRFRTIDDATHAKLTAELKKDDAKLQEVSFESIGPTISSELRSKSLQAIALALFMILIYISFVFRKVSYPVASWKYGVAAIIAVFHDLVFLVGVFAVLGKFAGVEITSAFIPAFLTVLGFSVHDTIVVFDRIRENLLKYRGAFDEIVEKSIGETIVRSINTSLTVLLVLATLYLFGGESLKTFALALLIGIGVGTYSSIFVASPLLVVWQNFSAKGSSR